MNPALQSRVREVHPELSFYELSGGHAMTYSKKERDGKGIAERKRLLANTVFGPLAGKRSEYRRSKVGQDDVLDACAACWTAARIFRGEAIRIPEHPLTDAHGLRMEIWR